MVECYYALSFMLSVIKLSVVMLSVAMLSVVLLSVVAPLSYIYHQRLIYTNVPNRSETQFLKGHIMHQIFAYLNAT